VSTYKSCLWTCNPHDQVHTCLSKAYIPHTKTPLTKLRTNHCSGWTCSYSPPTHLLVRATNEWFLPAWSTFRHGLASESHWLKPMLILTVHWWSTPVSVGGLIVTYELVELEKEPVEVGDFGRITDHFRGIYTRIYPIKWITQNRKMATYAREEPAVSYRWAGWVWEITGWSWRLQENCWSF
jgi:hypothetical protein